MFQRPLSVALAASFVSRCAAYSVPAIFDGPWSCGGAGFNCQSGSDAFGGGGNTGDASTHVYACVDWSVGSNLWENQECAYKARTGKNATFGVGSFGEYPSPNMGKCYEMTV